MLKGILTICMILSFFVGFSQFDDEDEYGKEFIWGVTTNTNSSLIGGAVFRLSLIHISEPTRQAEISYAVFCLKTKKKKQKKRARRCTIELLSDTVCSTYLTSGREWTTEIVRTAQAA